MLPHEIRSGKDLQRLQSLICNLKEEFKDAGAIELELPALIDADVLIELYGEDLRARAFTVTNPFDGKQILRPDFTVPVAQKHIQSLQINQRYCYSGPVWRYQGFGSRKSDEYYQVGLEIFHQDNAASFDAEVFKLINSALSGYNLHCEIGDMGILRALVSELDISGNKKSLLLRHLWRPDRFSQLLMHFSGEIASTGSRKELLKSVETSSLQDYIVSSGPIIGMRTVKDIVERAQELYNEELRKPISKTEVDLIHKIANLKCKFYESPDKLKQYSGLGGTFLSACENLNARIEAMKFLGIDGPRFSFSTRLSRNTMEYYDSFVFSFFSNLYPELPPIAQGGRYDALTAVLNKKVNCPAVGGIIRPEILLNLTGRQQ